jgi:hypothetical protein
MDTLGGAGSKRFTLGRAEGQIDCARHGIAIIASSAEAKGKNLGRDRIVLIVFAIDAEIHGVPFND